MAVLGTVAELWRFPVKSMQGERVDASEVTEAGLAGDRAYALVDTETGKLASAKLPRKWPDLLSYRATFVADPVPGQDFPPVRIEFPDGSSVTSDAPDVDAKLSAALGRGVTLTCAAPHMSLVEEWWPEVKGPDVYGDRHPGDDEIVTEYPASFAAPAGTHFDLSALHLISTSTIDALRDAYPSGRIDNRRFRANVVVATAAPGFVENDWKGAIDIGGMRADVMFVTPRCVMTTRGQDDLDEDMGVLEAMAEHNRIRAGGLGELPCAGVYATVAGGGRVAVGDDVTA